MAALFLRKEDSGQLLPSVQELTLGYYSLEIIVHGLPHTCMAFHIREKGPEAEGAAG